MKKFLGLVIAACFSLPLVAQEHEPHNGNEDELHAEEEGHGSEEFNATSHALHHALDAHEFHFTDGFVIPLPVILWTDEGLITFMSSEFHHDDAGQHVVTKKGLNFVKFHEKIYILEPGATHLETDAAHVPLNGEVVVMDLSLTKNVTTILLIGFLLIFVFFKTAKFYKYKDGEMKAPRGIAGWMEPVILFVRDIAKENIEGEKYKRFTPFLLTIFFFILFGNLLGLIPFLANPNVTGSVSITLLLATIVFIVQMFSTKKYYWKHILAPPGVPVLLYPILIPIEIAGIFIKPAALMIRLFANITAGHIIVVSLISIIFIKGNIAWAGLSVPFTLFISILEILVAFLQAYIFTMLSALYIGMATESGDHH